MKVMTYKNISSAELDIITHFMNVLNALIIALGNSTFLL